MPPENGNLANAATGDSKFWQSRTRLVQWRINAAWWLDAFQGTLFVGAVVLTVLVLIGRRSGWAEALLLWSTVGVFTAIAAVATLRARRSFVSPETARAELEARLGLHNRLSAAAAGIGPWPTPTEWQPRLWHWNWRRLGPLPLLSGFLLAGAFLVPIVGQQERQLPPMVKPPALVAVEEWLEALQQNEAIDQASLEPVQEQAEELAKQEPSEWYSHANLEAANHLQEQLQDGMRTLDQNAAALQSLLGDAQEMSDAAAQRWKERLDGALGSLSGNAPTLSRELANQLRGLDPSKLRNLSPDQLQQLQKQLSQARGACQAGLGEENGMSEDGESDQGEEGGRGDVNRGPGHAPLTLKSEETNLNTEKTETLENEDFSRAGLGDLAGLSDGQHEVDKQAGYRSAQGGKAAVQGAGPDAVWIQQSLKPEERQRLRQFYK